jgi:transcriptional regulator with XRE-family HTH domain
VSATDIVIGALLQQCRLARGVSARRLSLDAGLSESVVGKVESGSIDPSLRVFASIVAELHLNDREVAFLVALARARTDDR